MNLRATKGTAIAAVWIFGLLLSVLSESGCTMFGEHPAGKFAEATGGEGLERVFWKSVAAGNWTEVDRILASNYSGVTASGTLDKSAALAQYRQWQLKDYSLGDLKTELNGTSMVVTYAITLNGTAGAQPLPSTPQRMMSVWQQQKSGWIEIAHSTNLP
jgi:hypothetical protein